MTSSSATSQSPPSQSIFLQSPSEHADRELRQKAVDKFMARAEVSMVTRALRARLSYASYKATHNIQHVSLRDLEAQAQARAAAFPRNYNGKRKAGGNNYYNNPATQGGSTPTSSVPNASSLSPYRRGSGSGRQYYLNPDGTPPTGSYNSAQSRIASSGNLQANTLYSSILAPPPAKHARTIHNPNDPPLQAPLRPNPAEPANSPSNKATRSIAEGTRAQSKIRKDDKRADKRKGKQPDKNKNKRSRNTQSKAYGDQDVDMKAAATLTSLLLQSRPSMTASSPRSSISSEAGLNIQGSGVQASSTQASSTQTSSVQNSGTQNSITRTVLTAPLPPARVSTPVKSPARQPAAQTTTPSIFEPVPAPTDNEAADLMLFLATSPSPTRQTTRHDKDAADMKAYRALGGLGSLQESTSLKQRGRVLFSAGSGEQMEDQNRAAFNALSRGPLGDFSISSVGSEIRASPIGDALKHAQESPSASPKPPLSFGTPGKTASGPFAFNFNDFINVSPATPRPSSGTPGQTVRTDVGRRLFEGERVVGGNTIAGEELGAGIDLVPSPTR